MSSILKHQLLFFCILCFPYCLFAQLLTAHHNLVSNGYNFWVYTPTDYDSTKTAKPLIVFLHGASLCGNDLQRVRRYGPLNALTYGREIDAVIVAPQNPGGSWNPLRIQNVIDWVKKHYSTDSLRMYVLGMSLGGYGTIDYVATYPEQVAAAMALCGGGTRSSYCGLNTVPFWIQHGTADRDVGISQSQKVVNAMKQCGDTSLLRFDRLQGMNHGDLARVFYLKETYEWLFSHSRADTPRFVNKNIVITPAKIANAYHDLHRADKSFLKVKNWGNVSTETTEQSSHVETSDAPVYYTVKKGDTLSAIARKYHTSVSKLCKLNHIKETSILQIGKKLKVK